LASRAIAPRRARISVTVDPGLLRVVDSFVEAHPELNRGKVFDEALLLWYALLQENARQELLAATETIVGPRELTVARLLPGGGANGGTIHH
jgi:hypothetical protein